MMNAIQAAEFRTTFSKIGDPVLVMRYNDVIGTWYPGEHVCVAFTDETAWHRERVEMEEEIARLKRKLAHTSPNWQKFPSESERSVRDSFGYSRPVPKPKSK